MRILTEPDIFLSLDKKETSLGVRPKLVSLLHPNKGETLWETAMGQSP